MRDELNEEKRKCREMERTHATVMAAREKEHAALLRATQAKHDSRKVSLRYAQRMKDQAMDKLEVEQRRAEAAEQNAVRSHWEAQQLQADKTAKALAPKHVGSSGYGQKSDKALSDAAAAAATSPFARSAGSVPYSGSDWQDLGSSRIAIVRDPQRHLVSPPRARSASPASRLHPSPNYTPTRESEAKLDDRERAEKRALQMLPQGREPYPNHTDTMRMYGDSGAREGLFDRTSTSPRVSIPRAATALKEQLSKNLSKMGEVFRTWDRSGSGRIERVEFRLAVKALGIEASDPACDAVFREFDANGDGAVDYHEYMLGMIKEAVHRSSSQMQGIFAKMDSNEDGTISREEFRRGLQEFGMDASPADMDAVFDEIDVNGSGRIVYGELHALLPRSPKIVPAPSTPVWHTSGMPVGASPSGKALMTLPPSQWTSCDPINRSSTQSRDRRRGHAVAIHLERMEESRRQSPNERPTAGMR